jgi:hypothetical protein
MAPQKPKPKGRPKRETTYKGAAAKKTSGILPGDLGEKVAPWALPVLDVLIKHLGKGAVETGNGKTDDR